MFFVETLFFKVDAIFVTQFERTLYFERAEMEQQQKASQKVEAFLLPVLSHIVLTVRTIGSSLAHWTHIATPIWGLLIYF